MGGANGLAALGSSAGGLAGSAAAHNGILGGSRAGGGLPKSPTHLRRQGSTSAMALGHELSYATFSQGMASTGEALAAFVNFVLLPSALWILFYLCVPLTNPHHVHPLSLF